MFIFKGAAALVSLSGLFSTVLSTPTKLASRQTTNASDCAQQFHILALPGQGVINGMSSGPLGQLQLLTNQLNETFPNSTLSIVPYDKSSDILADENNATIVVGQYIAAYSASCPETPMVVLGYSFGAIATMNALCGGNSPFTQSAPISPQYSSQIIATILYGDESRTANQTYDLGTCVNNGEYPRPEPSTCYPYALNMQSYCDSDDPNCCQGGNNSSAHYQYPEKYDNDVVTYIGNQFNAYQLAHSNSSAKRSWSWKREPSKPLVAYMDDY